jgi:DNA-binding SARP family transcriptional activator
MLPAALGNILTQEQSASEAMSPHHLPRLIENRLIVEPELAIPQATDPILAGQPAWFAWLAQPEHTSFSYQRANAAITVRRERKRNTWYWYAYRAIGGKLRKVYLGRTEDLTPARLHELTAPLVSEADPAYHAVDARLTFFGQPHMQVDGQPVHLASAKAIALLAYLSVHDRPQRRDHLLALLWPESGEAQARKNLRNALWAIRTLAGHNIISGDSVLTLSPQAWSDARAFEQAYAEAQSYEANGADSCARYAEMVALCHDGFMDGVSLAECVELETWIALTRERYYEMRLRALRALALARSATGEWAEVIIVAETAIAQDPLQEPMYRALMEAQARLGDRSAALRQYETLRATLERELGVGPLPETEQLRADILQGAIPAASLSAEARATDAPTSVDQRPFVGREQEIAALDAVWAMAGAGSARVALVSGEVGVGKSRLWQMWSSRLPASVSLLTTRCLPTTQGLPFAPLAGLLRSETVWRRLAQVAQVSPPAWLDDILQLVPDLRESLPTRAQPPALPAIEEQRRMFEALIQGLGFNPTQRVTLFIDDLHWADEATIEWLGYLMHRGQELPFLLVIAYRQEEAPTSLLKQIAYWGREGVGRRLPLTRLSHDEALQLISELQGDMRRAESVYQQSAGNPYFLIELLRAEPGVMPIALTDLIALRLDQLPGVARQVLQVAAVLQPEIDLALLRAIGGRTEEETVDALESLTRAGLLLERQGAYEFGHPLIAHVVERSLSRARSSILHRRVAETLERIYAGRLADVSGRPA